MTQQTQSNVTSASGEASVSSANRGHQPQNNVTNGSNSNSGQQPGVKRKRNLPGMPDPDAEVIALSPKTLMATNRFVCEICNKGFQRDQNLQLHRRGHNLPWKLRQRTSKEIRKRVYICPEPTCVHHEASRALGDLTGIKKHFCRKHGEKKWKCDKCSKRYAVQSDWKAHSKTCGTREYRCDCGTLFSRRDSFITHRAFCDALAEESARATVNPQPGPAQSVGGRSNSSSSGGDQNNSRSAGGCPEPDVKISCSNPTAVCPISSAAATSLPPPPPAWAQPQAGAGGGSGPKLSLWHGPGPGPPLESSPSSTSSQFNVLDGTYSFPFFSSAPPAAPTIFSTLLAAGGLQPQNHPAYSELIGPRGGGAFSGGGGSLFSHQTSPSGGNSSAHMSATALLQKAAQMGATTSSNSAFLRGFGGQQQQQQDQHNWQGAGCSSSTNGGPTGQTGAGSGQYTQMGMQELMNSLSGGGLFSPGNLSLTGLLQAPLFPNGDTAATGGGGGALGAVKSEGGGGGEISSKDELQLKPTTTLDFLGLGPSGNTLSRTDLAMITSMNAGAGGAATAASGLAEALVQSPVKSWDSS